MDILKKIVYKLLGARVWPIKRFVKKLVSRNDKLLIIAKSPPPELKYLNKGDGNKVVIGKGSVLNNSFIRIVGNNNILEFGENCYIGPGSSFWMEGNNIRMKIGSHTTCTRICHFNCQEDGTTITVGEDCMFSNHIIVRTSDSHKIYNVETGERINPPKHVVIGNHVWIAPNSKVMKGAVIGDGSIIGSNTMVTKAMPGNSLIVGMPAKVVKQGVSWSRESIF